MRQDLEMERAKGSLAVSLYPPFLATHRRFSQFIVSDPRKSQQQLLTPFQVGPPRISEGVMEGP